MSKNDDALTVLRNRIAEVESKWGAPEGSDKQGREAVEAFAELIAAAKWVKMRAEIHDLPTDGLDAALKRIGGAA